MVLLLAFQNFGCTSSFRFLVGSVELTDNLRSRFSSQPLIAYAVSNSGKVSQLPGTSIIPKPESNLGFNYWPQGFAGCEGLTNTTWPQAEKKISADLSLMRSLGANVVRLTFWPAVSGYFQGGWPVTATSSCQKLPALINLLNDRGFKVIIAFSNTYLLTDEAGNYHWKGGYEGEDEVEKFHSLLSDSVEWINQIVDLVESSPDAAKNSVLYYDIQNEYDARLLNSDWYLRTVFGYSRIPTGSRGISILRAPEDLNGSQWAVVSQMEKIGGSLKYVDFHSYPVVPSSRCPLHSNIEDIYSQILNIVPDNTTVLMGEFGRRTLSQNDKTSDSGGYPSVCTDRPEAGERNWGEPGQEQTVMNLIDRAFAMGIPYALHWMLWDKTPSNDLPLTSPEAQVFGVGYSPHEPKDVLGAMATRFGLVFNPDMEIVENGIPKGWSGESWSESKPMPVDFFASNASSDAATHERFARVQANQTCSERCSIYVKSPSFSVNGGSRLFFNAFVRSNMKNIELVVTQYDTNGNRLNDLVSPAFTPEGWSWNNSLVRINEQNSLANGWFVRLADDAVGAQVIIRGVPRSTPAYLDVDMVSVSTDQID